MLKKRLTLGFGYGIIVIALAKQNKPEWRNGRRDGLKIRYWQQCVGSSPISGTIKIA